MNKILRESLYFRKDSNISRFSQILQHIFPNMIYTSANYSVFSPNIPKKLLRVSYIRKAHLSIRSAQFQTATI